jgi:hypothetical protein
MEFLLGIVVGFLASLSFLFAGLYLDRRGISPVKKLHGVARDVVRQKPRIIMPKSEEQIASEELIAKNDALGIATPLDQIRK